MKRISIVLMSLFMILSTTTSSLAQLSNDSNDDVPEGITILEKEDLKKTVVNLHSSKEFKEINRWLKEDGLQLDNENVAGLHMEKIETEKDEHFADVKHIAFTATDKDSNNVAVVVAIVNNKTGKTLSLEGKLFYNVDKNGSFSHLETYSMNDDGLSGKIEKETIDTQAQPEFTPCQHASIWICLYHCALWGAATGGYGAPICGVICAYAFNYGCNK